jgi:hypothetical protein
MDTPKAFLPMPDSRLNTALGAVMGRLAAEPYESADCHQWAQDQAG